MLTSVMKLSRISPGFDPDRVLTFKLALTGSNYAAPEARVAFTAALLQGLTASPGVRGAALTSDSFWRHTRCKWRRHQEPRVTGEPSIIIDQRHVTPATFKRWACRWSAAADSPRMTTAGRSPSR
jgi:hypothetical protein